MTTGTSTVTWRWGFTSVARCIVGVMRREMSAPIEARFEKLAQGA